MFIEMTDGKGSVWTIEVDRLLRIFRHGLVSLIPIFDEAMISWKGDQTYDDFERVAGALYQSIVSDSLANARTLQTALPLARYGLRHPGQELSRLLVGDPVDRLAFHELDTQDDPFDTIVCLRIDDDGRDEPNGFTSMPFDGQSFIFEARFGASRPPSHHRQVEVLL